MALALPVIATPWAGNRDLMSPDNSYPLEYKLVEIPARLRSTSDALRGTRWAEVSVEQIRASMRQAYSHSHEAHLKADRAQRQILDMCDWQRLATLMRGHLQEISGKLRRPPVRMASPGSRPHICWEGPQLVNHSLAVVNREIEMALIASNEVNLAILPVGQDSFGSSLSPESTTLTTHYGKQINKPIDVHVRHQWPANWIAPREGHWIVIQPWEYGSLPAEWVERINERVDEVWAPSEYVRRVYV